jgi:serine/threonine-protein kinase
LLSTTRFVGGITLQIASGTLIAGKYVLEAAIGQGGMGSVWRARHVKLQSEVAVKFMDPGIASSPAARERFEREARASARIDYIHIVRVHDYGIENNLPYIVMELLRGESLEDRLKRQFRLPIGELVPIVAQIGKALRKAHDARIVHRDLKPGNIFLVKSDDDDDEIVKLVDFGIAKETDASIGNTKTGEFMGSPHYMSPEQIQDSRAIDPRSDLWSLGIILFRCLTGTLPFPGETVGAVVGKVLTAPVPSPTSYVRGLPQGVEAFFQKALARDRSMRFQSAREMTDAFAALAGVPAPFGAGRRGSSAPWIQQDSLMASSGAHHAAGHLAGPSAPPPRASDSGFSARPSQPSPLPAQPAPSATPPVERGGKTIKMKPFKGPAPDPGPPKDPPAARRYTGTQPLSDGSQLLAGTLTASPSARETAVHGASGGPGQRLIDTVRAWPLSRKIAVGGGIAAAILLLLVVALRSPSAQEGDGLAAPGESASVAPQTAPSTPPSSAATAAESVDGAPVEVDLSETLQQPAPSNPSSVPSREDKKASQTLKPLPPGKAWVTINGQGGSCSVSVNGRFVGSTPIKVILDPGRFALSCIPSNGKLMKQDIHVRSGDSRTVWFTVSGRVPEVKGPGVLFPREL